MIKADVLRAINAFFVADRRQFHCVNGALVTLIPKVQEAKAAKDFRPISLIHSFPKLISKLLANQLAPHLPTLISKNQSAFIKGRSILDNFKYEQQAARLLKARKIPKILLKLDISKAFDMIA